MRKIAALLIALSFVFVGCNEKSKPEEKEVIKIGVILPLTGNMANQGKKVLNGIKLALENSNNTNSFFIKLIVEDSQGKPDQAVSAYNKISNVNKANYIIGDLLSSSTLAIAPLIHKNKQILISPTASSPLLSKYYPFFIRLYPSDYYDAKIASDFCYNELNMKDMIIFSWNNDYY